MSKHTPGPWIIQENGNEYNCDIGVENGDSIVLSVSNTNAHLIAAAPDLLSALEKARDDINWMLNSKQFLNGFVFDYINEAITKATTTK